MDRAALWLMHAGMLTIAAATALWTAGAIYFDVCHGGRRGRWIAECWLIGIAAALVVWRPFWRPFVTLVGVESVFLGVWLRLKPSHARDWDASVTALPRARRDGDLITIENVRNFQYRTLEDFTPHYETRAVQLSNLRAVDIIFFNWGSPWMSHPVLSFDFGSDGRICVSIEVRYRRGQKYSVLRSLYRQQELIFVVADERDIILRRTKYGPAQQCRLYQMNVSSAQLRDVFLDYLEQINELYVTPRWYHGVCANCTTSFYRLPHARLRFDWRVIANGRLDKALYEDGKLDATMPFEELQQFAMLNEIANNAPEVGFSGHIRRELARQYHERRHHSIAQGA